MATLSMPEVLELRLSLPNALLAVPEVLSLRLPEPNALLLDPVVLELSPSVPVIPSCEELPVCALIVKPTSMAKIAVTFFIILVGFS